MEVGNEHNKTLVVTCRILDVSVRANGVEWRILV